MTKFRAFRAAFNFLPSFFHSSVNHITYGDGLDKQLSVDLYIYEFSAPGNSTRHVDRKNCPHLMVEGQRLPFCRLTVDSVPVTVLSWCYSLGQAMVPDLHISQFSCSGILVSCFVAT